MSSGPEPAPKPKPTFRQAIEEPVTRRDMMTISGAALLLTGIYAAFPAIDRYFSSDPALSKNKNEVINALNQQIGEYYSTFVATHYKNFWKNGEGFELRNTSILVHDVTTNPLRVHCRIFDHSQDQEFGSDPGPGIFEHTIEVKKGEKFDYELHFEAPLLAFFNTKLPHI